LFELTNAKGNNAMIKNLVKVSKRILFCLLDLAYVTGIDLVFKEFAKKISQLVFFDLAHATGNMQCF
jgi:kynureninase